MLNKEAIQFLMEQGINPSERDIQIVDTDGNERHLIIGADGEATEIKPLDIRAKEALYLSTLTSLVDYIQNLDRKTKQLFVHIENEKTVNLLGPLDHYGKREHLATAIAITPEFTYGKFHDVEELIVSIQSKFVETKDSKIILKVIGNVKEENVRNTGDTGFSQEVTIKTGVANVENVKVQNPVALAPYRTFLEVDQPVSEFVFRMKDGPTAAIFEADGGVWRNKAISYVKEFLEVNLEDSIKGGNLIILA